jgi:hypothetical protein
MSLRFLKNKLLKKLSKKETKRPDKRFDFSYGRTQLFSKGGSGACSPAKRPHRVTEDATGSPIAPPR